MTGDSKTSRRSVGVPEGFQLTLLRVRLTSSEESSLSLSAPDNDADFTKNIPRCFVAVFPNSLNDSARHMGLAMSLKLTGPSGSPRTRRQRHPCCVCEMFALT